MKYFTSKAYLVTFEQSGGGFGCRQYGIAAICNKTKEAQIQLERLNKESENNSRIEYKIQEIGLNEHKELFQFYY